jgi:hypothetical protein
MFLQAEQVFELCQFIETLRFSRSVGPASWRDAAVFVSLSSIFFEDPRGLFSKESLASASSPSLDGRLKDALLAAFAASKSFAFAGANAAGCS